MPGHGGKGDHLARGSPRDPVVHNPSQQQQDSGYGRHHPRARGGIRNGTRGGWRNGRRSLRPSRHGGWLLLNRWRWIGGASRRQRRAVVTQHSRAGAHGPSHRPPVQSAAGRELGDYGSEHGGCPLAVGRIAKPPAETGRQRQPEDADLLHRRRAAITQEGFAAPWLAQDPGPFPGHNVRQNLPHLFSHTH